MTRRGIFPPKRAMCLAVLLAPACSSTLEPPTGDPALDLRHRDPRVRVLAALEAVEQRRADLAAELVKNLDDPDGAVRLYSAVALRKLTGEEFGYLPFAPPAERRAALERWKAWLKERNAGGVAASPHATSRPREPIVQQ